MEVKVTRTIRETINVAYLQIVVPVDYGEEDMPADYPGRVGNLWSVLIDVDTGQIQNWTYGSPALELYMKVCDGGDYSLMDNNNRVLALRVDEYVPSAVSDDSDYIKFDIDASGRITNWSRENFVEYIGAFFDDTDQV